jgi:hypothetical protein
MSSRVNRPARPEGYKASDMTKAQRRAASRRECQEAVVSANQHHPRSNRGIEDLEPVAVLVEAQERAEHLAGNPTVQESPPSSQVGAFVRKLLRRLRRGKAGASDGFSGAELPCQSSTNEAL